MSLLQSTRIEPGAQFERDFSFTQEEVAIFAALSGDRNPLHLDADYAATTSFKQPIIHGFLGASIFSRMLAMDLPGPGTVYLSQQLSFKRPMYPGQPYRGRIKVEEVDQKRHQARFLTEVRHAETGKVCILGEAWVMNREQIGT